MGRSCVFVFLLVLGLKPRVLCILRKYSPTEPHPQLLKVYFIHINADDVHFRMF
jgi:hypothetical protein